MVSYLQFGNEIRELAEDWVTQVESASTWELGIRLDGEAGAHEAVNEAGIRAVAKPSTYLSDGEIRASHEKIAADLAHHVGVPVPPVCLWTNQKTGRCYSISAWAFPECLTWIGAKQLGILSADFIRAARPIITVGMVFHTWIGNIDPHGGNVLVDARCSELTPKLAFIDHAFSMSKTWRDERAALQKAGTDYCGSITIAPVAAADITARIQSLDPGIINNIVNRVPENYLPTRAKNIIIANLVRRRRELAGAFGVI
ncbi:MAG: hypothetical protein HZA68_12595 [Rhodovulum sp.]|nr:hypothetical protein [Rhodovulum sp.]